MQLLLSHACGTNTCILINKWDDLQSICTHFCLLERISYHTTRYITKMMCSYLLVTGNDLNEKSSKYMIIYLFLLNSRARHYFRKVSEHLTLSLRRMILILIFTSIDLIFINLKMKSMSSHFTNYNFLVYIDSGYKTRGPTCRQKPLI